MSERPTPETDAQASVGLENADRECVPADFARRLERQRDEAREVIIGWENKWKCAIEMAAKAELERDDAREVLKEIASATSAVSYPDRGRAPLTLKTLKPISTPTTRRVGVSWTAFVGHS